MILMRKIGTITFHWATNYGAVLQAYALQAYLKKRGFDTEIIDYVPFRIKLIEFIKSTLSLDFTKYKKERRIRNFRKKELALSKRYRNDHALKKCANDYDTVICGSDQIWNQSFTLAGEGHVTLSYFLAFANRNVRKIAYATSFGTDQVSNSYVDAVSPEIYQFHAISVRENTGVDIVQQLGGSARLVCDPTLLLERSDYETLIADKHFETSPVFSYILHKDQTLANDAVTQAKAMFGDASGVVEPNYGIYEWLYRISHAKMVVTNSYHGMLFSLIFHVPFVVVPVENSGMNNRIATVLQALGLTDRMLDSIEGLEKICLAPIDWERVNQGLSDLRDTGVSFLEHALQDDM